MSEGAAAAFIALLVKIGGHVLIAIGVAEVVRVLTSGAQKVARKKSSSFRQQATKEPYELELDSGEIVVFLDPNQMETESSFDLAREDDPERALRLMIREGDWDKFWAEYRTRPQGETNATLEDAMEYYQVNRAKRRSSAS